MESTVGGGSLRGVSLGPRRPAGDVVLPSSKSFPTRVKIGSGFWYKDDGHLRYYASVATTKTSASCGLKKEEKRRKKLVKGLEKDLYAFSSMGFGVGSAEQMVCQVKGQLMSEASDVLVSQLSKVRAEAKEMKKQRKLEKKAAKKAAKMKDCSSSESSSSSSESSDSECERVVKMSSLQRSIADPVIESPLETEQVIAEAQKDICSIRNNAAADLVMPAAVIVEVDNKIEVCMGVKCKKSGAMELMAEFEKKVGIEGAVVGCKCMGKCRDAPNVRLVSSSNVVEEDQGAMKMRKTLKGPLCIGVGLEDVGSILAMFLGETQDVAFLSPL